MTEELCRHKFEEWFKPKSQELAMNGLGLITIARQREKQWEAYKAAWNTRAEMEKS